VKSPTFVLEHRYRGRVPIRHLDLYRLEDAGEDLRAAWDEESGESIILVEWAERVEEPPPEAVWVHLIPSGARARWVRLEWRRLGSPLRHLDLDGRRPGETGRTAA